MFIVNNKKIQGEKTLSIGQNRFLKLSFQFQDADFLDADDFTLIIGDVYSFNYAFRNNGFLSFRDVDVSQIITQSEQDFNIKVYQGEDLILDDTVTIKATIGDIDLSGYVTTKNLNTTLSSYATTSYANSLINNILNINTITDDTDTIAIAYNPSYDIVEVDNTTNTASITINPCTGYTANSNNIPTFQLWIKPVTKKTTVSVSNSIIVVGDIPQSLDANAVHCFTFRFVGQNQLLNYAYSYTPTVSSDNL